MEQVPRLELQVEGWGFDGSVVCVEVGDEGVRVFGEVLDGCGVVGCEYASQSVSQWVAK